MKFGKELLHAAQACESIVHADWWIDYKVLKKMLKHNPMENDDPAMTKVSQKQRILNSQVERRFFSALQVEVSKVDSRYKELKQKAMEMAHSFLLQSPLAHHHPDPIRVCANIHLYLLVVKNYGVMNYCGFKKILKKHDKLRGVTTKDSYMVKVVNHKSFARYEEFRTLLVLLEKQYLVLSNNAPLTLNSVMFETQRKELEIISEQGNCQLELLADAAAVRDDKNLKESFPDAKRPRLMIPSYGEFYL